MGAGENGVFLENSTNTKTGESKTTGGLQGGGQTPEVNNTSIKVNAKIYIGDD